jgi:endonuclease YncB( thermonuclease family)
MIAILILVQAVLTPPIIGRASVTDGDTIEIRGERIRLNGIDAPESAQQCQKLDGSAWPCGRRAALALSDHIGIQNVSCQEQSRDRYGRIVANCTLAGRDLSAWMVGSGYALAYVRYTRDYAPQENQARRYKRGIWAGYFQAPWEWRRNRNSPMHNAVIVPPQ